MTGQTSTSPFMSIRDGTNRKVSFNTRDELGDKIDKLTVMLGRLAAKDDNDKRPFKPQIYQSRGRGQNIGYSQRSYQSGNRLGNRSGSRDRGQFGWGIDRPRFQQNYRRNNFEECTRGYRRQNSRGSIEMIGVMVTIKVGIGQERDDSQEIIPLTEIEVQTIVDQHQDLEPVPIGTE